MEDCKGNLMNQDIIFALDFSINLQLFDTISGDLHSPFTHDDIWNVFICGGVVEPRIARNFE